MWFFQSQHQENIEFKRREREERINALPEYKTPVTANERSILDLTIPEAVKLVKAGEINKRDLLTAYGKEALVAHEHTNAITEIMIKDAETWSDETSISTPLAGFPVSLKDPFRVKGYDATQGFSALTRKPVEEDDGVTALIKDAGGVPYVKTNVPVTMMNFEGYNDIWGRTVNPHNASFAPGGSSQGEGALIGFGGSRIGIGTDIGGSVRVPAAWSGIYSLRMTSYRFPLSSDPEHESGFEAVPAVASPMARTLPDLRYFTDSVMALKPWKYDFHLVPLPWRPNDQVPKQPTVGVLKITDYVTLSPAIERAIDTTTEALRRQGCKVVDFELPVPARSYHETITKLFLADGLVKAPLRVLSGEHNEPTMLTAIAYLRLPRWLRKSIEFFLRLFGLQELAGVLSCHEHYTVSQYYELIVERDRLRYGFRNAWNASGIDFLITAAFPTPAVPNGRYDSVHAGVYTQLWNLLDYPAGIVPVSRVSEKLDARSDSVPRPSGLGALMSYDVYDAKAMAGLPTAIQVVGMRYEDEMTLSAMEYVVEALRKAGVVYK